MGEEITLTIKPEGENILMNLKISRGTTSVDYKKDGNTVKFTMPSGDVTISATFGVVGPYFSKDFDTSLCSFWDKFEGNTLDLTKWGHQNGNGSDYGQNGWGNSEAQSYKTENVVIEGGVLKLKAKREG